MWVEATWEVMVGCIMAWGLIKVLGASRKIVTTWLYIEVALMFGSGILGLGHHYFWIGTPEYWLSIGGFFSALEPIPLVAILSTAPAVAPSIPSDNPTILLDLTALLSNSNNHFKFARIQSPGSKERGGGAELGLKRQSPNIML